MSELQHQNKLPPAANKFHVGNGDDGKHYWLTPPGLYATLAAEFRFDFDPCPFPKPEGFDGLTCEWGASSYVNPPFGSILHQGPGEKKPTKKGPTAWARKAITEYRRGKRVVLVYPIDKWVLMLLGAGARVRNLGDVKWLATEDGSQGKGTGRHIAAFVLEPRQSVDQDAIDAARYRALKVRHGYRMVTGLLGESGYSSAHKDAQIDAYADDAIEEIAAYQQSKAA